MEDKRTNDGPIAMELEGGEHYWCTCGCSTTHPICDLKTHKGSGNAPHRFKLEEKKTVHVCRCGRTGNRPFCDGSHRKA